MIKGIGTDLVEIERMGRLIQEQPRFIERVLTQEEQTYFSSLQLRRQKEFLAGRFAAKEAISKALKTGVGKHFSWHDVSILPDEHGAPDVLWHKENTYGITHISISHTEHYAMAYVVIEQ